MNPKLTEEEKKKLSELKPKNRKHYDKKYEKNEAIFILAEKGYKDKWKKYAISEGLSMSKFIIKAVEYYIKSLTDF